MTRLAALVVCALALIASGAGAQRTAVRFEIVAVDDSTITFATGPLGWVQAGVEGVAVDPTRRDALVARYRVLHVEQGQAVALVTGQTMRVSTEHVALLDAPRTRFYRSSVFWVGTVLGLVLGGTAGFLAGS